MGALLTLMGGPIWGFVKTFWKPLAIALSALLQVAVVHVPVLNLAFGTSPLEPGQWAVCAAMGSLVLWYSELRKLAARAWAAPALAPQP